MKQGVIAFALMLATAVMVTFVVVGPIRSEGRSEALRTRLTSGSVDSSAPVYGARQLEGLPAPVRAYLQTALEEGQPIVKTTRVSQWGEMRMKPRDERWRSFSATQLFVADHPGFEWNARLRLSPGVIVFVSDSYIAGHGHLEARMFGLFSVAEAGGSPGMARGELLRFLAEAVWFPTAFLPGQGIRWDPIDDHSARATLSDGPTSVSLDFHFGPNGLVDSIFTPSRDRNEEGRNETAPWRGRFFDYTWHGGMQIPQRGEVEWDLEGKPWLYWRGSLKDIAYEFRQAPFPSRSTSR